jgi:hypothetical protein
MRRSLGRDLELNADTTDSRAPHDCNESSVPEQTGFLDRLTAAAIAVSAQVTFSAGRDRSASEAGLLPIEEAVAIQRAHERWQRGGRGVVGVRLSAAVQRVFSSPQRLDAVPHEVPGKPNSRPVPDSRHCLQ